MPARGTLTFSDNGFLLETEQGYRWQNLPPRAKTNLEAAKRPYIFSAAFGPQDGCFCYWSEGGARYWVRELQNYPGLQEFFEDREKTKHAEWETLNLSLGPMGSYWLHLKGSGQKYYGLDLRLATEIKRRLHPDGGWIGDPVHVSLGVDGSYVLIGSKGDIFWDLKGKYEVLDELLLKVQTGVKNIVLSPFDGRIFYIVLIDGQERYRGPREWILSTKK